MSDATVRDPRRDPFPGDVLRKGRVTREVTGYSWNALVDFSLRRKDGNNWDFWVTLALWRRWAKGADVLVKVSI